MRRTGRAGAFGSLGIHDWRPFEADAFIALGRLDDAGAALAEIDASVPAPSLPPPRIPAARISGAPISAALISPARITAARLHGELAASRGDSARSAQVFSAAWEYARRADRPLLLAQLELAEARLLRQTARRAEAIARLRSARGRLARLGARPYVSACDQELAACGVQIRPGVNHSAASHATAGHATASDATARHETASHAAASLAATGHGSSPRESLGQGSLGLTASELAVAQLVAAGRSNREAAAELYVSIKGIEFHLSNIFTKLGIRSRRALAECLGDHPDAAAPQATNHGRYLRPEDIARLRQR